MMMDPSKDYYEQRLAAHAHQAWAAAAAYHNPAAQHYMQRIQQFFPPSHSSTPPQQPPATAPNPYSQTGRNEHSSSLGSQNVKEQVYSGSPQLNNSASVSGGNSYPPGHPMHFPGIDYRQSHRASPTPAHSGNGNAPLPAHRSSPSLSKARDASEAATGIQPAAVANPSNAPSPLPAHMRSNPYQPTTNYHNLNSSYHHPASQLMHHPSYLPPSGTPPASTASSHYPPLSSNPPHLPQTMASNNSNSTMPHSSNSSEISKYPPHRADYLEQPKLPLNDPRSLVPNGGLHLGETALSTGQHYPSNQHHPRDGNHQQTQHNYNNNYNNANTAPEDFSSSGRNDNRRKDSLNSLDGKLAYNKQHRIDTPTTSISSPNSFTPYSSQYGNHPLPLSAAPSVTSVGSQPQADANYGNAYTGVPGYGSHIYNDRGESSIPPTSLHQPHLSNQTIVQPRGPTIDASNKYSAPVTQGADPSLRNLHKGSYGSTMPLQNQDQRRHHHSSWNSSGNDDHQRNPSYPNQHSTHQPYTMQNSNSTPSLSNPLRQDGVTSNSSNRIMPPVTGHPYMPQNVPLPPPDVSMPHQPQHHYPNIGEGAGPAYSAPSQMSRNVYPKHDGSSYEVSNREPEQSTYAPHQIYTNQQQLPSTPSLNQHTELTAPSNKLSSASVSGSDLQHSLISQVKEKTQSGSWKRKHSVDGKKTNSEYHHSHKKARLSLEAQRKDKSAVSDNNDDDPYAFDDDIEKSSVGSGSNSNSGVEFARFSVNGRQGPTSSGPVYKFKSALLSREQSKSNTPEPAYQVPSPYGISSNVPQNDKRGDHLSNRGGPLSQNFVTLNSISVPLRFDQSDNYFSVSCESFLSDLLSKPISVSRRPSIDNWKSSMAARAEKKADKRKAKELRKELAAEKAAALEKALVEKGSVVPAKVKGAAEQRDLEKRLDSNNFSSHTSLDEHRGRASVNNRSEDKKSQHVTFSPIPPVQYPPPPTPPNGDSGYASNASSNANPGYAISNVSNLPPAMQIPAFQPQPQYYSSNSHTLMQSSSTSSSSSSTSGSASHPSMSNMPKGNLSSPYPPPPQRNATMTPKFDEKQRQSISDKKIANKSKSSSVPSRQPDGRIVNEDQKENRPKKSSSTKSPAKAESNRHKLEKNSTSPTKTSHTRSPSAAEKRKADERMAKEKEDLKGRQVNGNLNALQSSNEGMNEKSLKDSKDGPNKPKVKKGALWAMPIVPKPPQKPNEKRKSQTTIPTPVIPNVNPATAKKNDSHASSSKNEPKPATVNKAGKGVASDEAGNGALVDVWRQAFGAVKPKKPVEASPLNNKLLIKQEIDAETCKKITYLDIPPEVRRRPKPSFGGLIHFPPDWERAVKRHHEKCRLPNQLIKGIKANPQILCKNNVAYDSKQLSPVGKDGTSSAAMSPPFSPNDSKYSSLSSYLGNPDNYSPPKPENVIYGDKKSSSNVVNFDKDYPYLLAKNKKSGALDDSFDLEDKLSFGANNVVDNILLSRKRLREGFYDDGALGRMYKLPFMKEKRKKHKKSFDKLASETNGEGDLGIMPTPGLPLLTADTTEVLMTTGNFGNFRRHTLLRYLDSLNNSPDLKAKLLDWKPEVFETKTRRQSNQVKAVTSYREIFGIDLPQSNLTKSKRGKDGYQSSPPTSGTSTPTKKSAKKEKEKVEKATKPEIPTPSKKSKKQKKEDELEKEKIEKEEKDTKTEKEKVETPEKKKDQKAKSAKMPKQSPAKSKKVEPANDKKSVKDAEKQKEDLKIESKSVETVEPVAVSKDIASPIPSTSDTPIKIDKPKTPRMPKKTKKQLKLEAEARARGELSDDDNYEPTEEENQLQDDLQAYALDLLETNKSWERRRVIQNLVIWEAVDPVPLTQGVPLPGITMAPTDPLWQRGIANLASAGIQPLAAPIPTTKGGKRKSKKFKKRSSGLDFGKRKSTNAVPNKASSRDTSRANSPVPGATSASGTAVLEPLTEVVHSLDHVVNEGRHWVINKSAGETILHRAAKQGLPDIAAYALSMAKMSPSVKDNGGIPPIHKAAFHGHQKIVELLLKFGTDPNTNVKGTRPLHEALEGGSRRSVHQLLSFGSDPMLYDYSGNMPIDLAEGNDDMHEYFGSVLADLHGKESRRWNVSNNQEFSMPGVRLYQQDEIDSLPICLEDTFDLSYQPLPAYYRIGDKPGQYALNVDLRRFTSIDFTRGTGSCSRFEVISMSKEDFIRTARCCLLGHKPNISASLNPHDGLIYLVKVDNYLQKIMGVEASSSISESSNVAAPSTPKKTKGGDGKNKKSTTNVSGGVVTDS